MSRGSLARIGERPRTWVRTKAKDNAEAQRHRERFGVGGFVTELQTGARKRGCKLLIPKARFLRYPHPRCFGKRGWICLILKELTFLATTKRLQEYGNKRVGANYRGELVEVTRGRVPQILT